MRRRLTALSAVVLLTVFLSVAVLRTAHAAAGCQVTYALTYSSSGYFGVDLRLTNLGDPVTSWQLTWSFTEGQTVAQGWNGVFSQSGGRVTVENASWNGAVGAGETLYMGFNGNWIETNPPPEDFAFNGEPCDLVIPSPTPTVPVPPVNPLGKVLRVEMGAGGFHPARRAAAGGVHALSYPNHPADSILRTLRLNKTVQQAPHSWPLSESDPLLIATQVDRAGIGQYIRMSERLPGEVIPWASMDEWLSTVDAMVEARLNRYWVSNVAGWEIWNEPDQTWVGKPVPFREGWLQTYRQIRLQDRVTPIVGPSLSHWDPVYLRDFLAFARDYEVLPQAVSWHEVDDTPAQIAAHVAEYRQIESDLRIGPLPISIVGYGDADEVHVPGRMASYIAKLERAGVTDAQRAYWGTVGTVSGLVADDTEPTGVGWLYKWYGEMAGNMVQTTPPSQTGLDGFAAYDGTRQLLHIVAGDEAGTNSVRVRGLAMGATVRVTVESTPATAPDVPVGPPNVLSDEYYQVVNGEIVVNIPDMRATDAYRITVQPISGTVEYQSVFEAENASLIRATTAPSQQASNGGYVRGLTASTNSRLGAYVDFIIDAPTTRNYVMQIVYSNSSGATAVQGLSENGDDYRALVYPQTSPGVFQSISLSVRLNAGYNVLRFATCAVSETNTSSPGCASGVGSADLDYIQLY